MGLRFFSGWRAPACAAVLVASASARPAAVPRTDPPKFGDVSGLAWVGDGLVLAVSDAKVASGAARFALFGTDDGKRRDLAIEWPPGMATNDLEAICRVPGTADQYLAVESGVHDPARGGFAYRVWLDRSGAHATLRFVERLDLPADLTDQIEGVAAWRAGERLAVVFGLRVSGELVVTELVGNEFQERERLGTSGQACERERRIGELCVVEYEGGRPLLLAAQTDDPPGDRGPFGSTLVWMGAITPGGELELAEDSEIAAVCEGLKIEGLCPSLVDGVLIGGTDDEGFGPVLRGIRVR